MRHLNNFLARGGGGGHLNKNFPNIQMPGGGGGEMLKLQFDW